ncbi:MAG: IS110 family transposase [Acidobacteria bacterium]|nr:IS110 family transposase [Acidobacteriota bacterium]
MAVFYRQWPAPAVVGVESSGYARWFHQLVEGCGHRLLVGDAYAIRQFARRRQKNDRRDAALLLDLLVAGEFPAVHMPPPASQEVLTLLRHRHRLVKMRTLLKNSLQALALNYRLRRGPGLFTERGRENLQALPVTPAEAWHRQDALQLLKEFQDRVLALEQELAARAPADPRVGRLRTHPGVGLLTALAFVHTLEPVRRFAHPSQLAAYCGLDPQEHSSGEVQRFGHISKQGNRLLRFLLTEAAQAAVRPGQDPELRRFYFHLREKKNSAVATVAVARKLALRLFVLLRDQIDYDEFWRRGRDARRARKTQRPVLA